MTHQITDNTLLMRSAAQVSCAFDQETVVMYLETGKYFSMDQVGSRIWALLANEQPFGQLLATLQVEFAATPRECREDTLLFLEQLQHWNLLEVRGCS